MSLLGAMMLDRESVGLVLQIIPREESWRLYLPRHRKLFEVLVEMYDAGKAIDFVLLRSDLEQRGLWDEVGGVNYITDLIDSVPHAAHVEHHARLVRDKALLRELIQCAGTIIEEAYDHREDAQALLDHAEKRLFDVTQKRIRNPALAVRDLLGLIFEQLQEREGLIVTGVPTGFLELDDITSGFQPGELIIVAARPSMGKTALGLSLAEHIAIDERQAVAFFSMEMGRQQIVQRLLCSRGRVDSHKLRRGMLSEEEIAKLQAVADLMQDKPIFIDDTPGMSVMELRAKARRLHVMHKLRAVVVDYLQLMTDPLSARESRQHEIATISRGLKALARELSVPVVALAQLNRNPEGREGNRPRMSDLRESGAIEQDADMVILLHREEYYLKDKKDEKSQSLMEQVRGKAELIIAKQRNGPTGTVELMFNDRYTRFDTLSTGPEPDYVPRATYSEYEETVAPITSPPAQPPPMLLDDGPASAGAPEDTGNEFDADETPF